MQSYFAICAAVVSVFLNTEARAFHANSAVVQVLGDWANRQARVDTMYYELELKKRISAAVLASIPGYSRDNPEAAGQDLTEIIKVKIWADLSKNRLRIESTAADGSSPADSRRATTHLILYDGSNLQSVNDGGGVQITQHRQGSRSVGLAITADLLPLFEQHGILAGPDGGITPVALRRVYTEGKYHLQSQGGDAATLITSPVDNSGTTIEHEVDLRKASLPIRTSVYSVDNKTRALSRETRALPVELDGNWLFGGWSHHSFNRSGEADLSFEYSVIDRKLNVGVDDVVFHIAPEVGQLYYDEKSNSVFEKSSSGKPDLQWGAAQALKESERSGLWRWYASLGACVLLLVVAFCLHRRQRV